VSVPHAAAYLGKADALLARLQATEPRHRPSCAHRAVAALWAVAQALDMAGVIDRHLGAAGRHAPGHKFAHSNGPRYCSTSRPFFMPIVSVTDSPGPIFTGDATRSFAPALTTTL